VRQIDNNNQIIKIINKIKKQERNSGKRRNKYKEKDRKQEKMRSD
jgi:hypothetical protein